MKRFLTLILSLAALSFTSCKTEDEYYYIRYNVSSPRGNIIYTDEYMDTVTVSDGNIGGNFQRTIGPVSKGFTSRIFSPSSGYMSIECCRGSEPFTTKTSGFRHLVYKIDY